MLAAGAFESRVMTSASLMRCCVQQLVDLTQEDLLGLGGSCWSRSKNFQMMTMMPSEQAERPAASA
jgi:hypothetical protein